MRLALYQPDIPHNTGALLRLAACFDLGVDIIEPCGFVWSDARLRRAGMDYLDRVDVRRHATWAAFRDTVAGRLLLLTTKGSRPYTGVAFLPADTILLGQESAGVPAEVHGSADMRLVVPIAAGMRSLNVAMAAAIVVGEALRQTDGFAHRSEER